jgi:hypothetical protein
MFANINAILCPGGRFVFADVCAGTTLARHFDEIVAHKCLTGHKAQFLNEKLVREIAKKTGFTVERSALLHVGMKFNSRSEAALFFKCLHAYDLSETEILCDLETVLGIAMSEGLFIVNWPLMFCKLVKR